MNKLLLIIVVGIFILLLGNVNADLGTFKKDLCVELIQTCENCSYVNLTRVSYPNSTIALNGNFSMTRYNSVYNYSFCDTNVTGIYVYLTQGDLDGATTTGNELFTITETGTALNDSQTTLYSILIFIVFLVFVISVYGTIKLPMKNPRSEEDDQILGVSNLKYAKILLGYFSYMVLLFIFGIGEDLTTNYLPLTSVHTFFDLGYLYLVILALPLLFMTFAIFVISWINDKKIQRILERGIPER